MEILSVLIWVGVMAYFVITQQQKTQAPKTIIQGKKAQDFIVPQESYTVYEQSLERQIQENVEVVYRSQEKNTKKPKVSKEVRPISLPAIKSTKPPKPEKPKKAAKEAKEEDYKNTPRPAHPLTTYLENQENVRNAFILSEVFRKKF